MQHASEVTAWEHHRHTFNLGVGISTILEIIGHFPVWSWLHIITCSPTQGTRMYIVYGWDLNGFQRYWSTSGLRGMGPFPMVMISIPSNAPWHKEQKYIWFIYMGIITVFNIYGTSSLRGAGPLRMVMTYIPSDATRHKKQEYIVLGWRSQCFWEIRTLPIEGG
jgi:hypothetical protein